MVKDYGAGGVVDTLTMSYRLGRSNNFRSQNVNRIVDAIHVHLRTNSTFCEQRRKGFSRESVPYTPDYFRGFILCQRYLKCLSRSHYSRSRSRYLFERGSASSCSIVPLVDTFLMGH